MYTDKRVEKYLNIAKEASEGSDFPQHKLGAAIIYHGVPLAVSCNTTKTNPVQKYYNKEREDFDVEADYVNNNSLHAEISCLLKIKNLDIEFNKASIFIYRATKDGRKALSRPCEACRRAIKDFGIKDIYYSIEDGWTHEHLD